MALILGEYYEEDTTEIYLSGTNLTMIPTAIFKLTNLEVLHLNHNQIKKIPKQINQLKKLKSLKISYNQLDTIPRELFALSQLENLHMAKIKIQMWIQNYVLPKYYTYTDDICISI